jgi:hypothetical protein
MPRDSNGNYTLPSTGNPVLTGTTISSTWANATLNDLAAEMTDSLDRSGKGGMLSAFKVFDGTVGAPGLAWASEPTSGLYRIGADDYGFSISGNKTLEITLTKFSAPNINVTGTTPPAFGLYAPLNQLGIATNSILRGYIDINGQFNYGPPTAGVALTVNGIANSDTLNVNGSTTSGQSYGAIITAGTTSVDYALYVRAITGTPILLTLYGDGHFSLGNNGTISTITGSSFGAVTINGTNGVDVLTLASGSLAATPAAELYITRGGSNANNQQQGPSILLQDLGASTFSILQHSGGQTEIWQFNGSYAQVARCLTTHNFQFLDDGGTMQTVGWRDTPQNLVNGNYAFVLADRGKQVAHTSGTAHTWTIPANASVPFPIGTVIRGVNTGGNVTIQITSDTLTNVSTGATGTRTIIGPAAYTLEKIGATSWFISGIGVT